MPLKLLDYQGLEVLAEFINKNSDDIYELGEDFQKFTQLVTETLTELQSKIQELDSVIEQLKNTGARYNSSIVYNS